MKHNHKVAARIHKAVTDFERQGLSDRHLTEAMLPHMLDLQDLWNRVGVRELREFCLTYPGLHRFSVLMQEFSANDEKTRKSGTHLFLNLSELDGPFRNEVERLLQLAGDLQAGKVPTEERITLLYGWQQDVRRLLLGDLAGPIDKGAIEILTAVFDDIEIRL
ncbi:hypothetical protein [uncultured Roseibium sp.]|uniref:hypothetical protein n=1 Tax=uncultured Roseibium sp. TaxID=1936171 RepID=UPI002602764B|nr:hypothetical protein [uncultured Roseibium sp.]